LNEKKTEKWLSEEQAQSYKNIDLMQFPVYSNETQRYLCENFTLPGPLLLV
jgi:hypothetical protein